MEKDNKDFWIEVRVKDLNSQILNVKAFRLDTTRDFMQRFQKNLNPDRKQPLYIALKSKILQDS